MAGVATLRAAQDLSWTQVSRARVIQNKFFEPSWFLTKPFLPNMAGFYTAIPRLVLPITSWLLIYSFALTSPLTPSDDGLSLNLPGYVTLLAWSNSRDINSHSAISPPEKYPIPNAPTLQIKFQSRGKALDYNDCSKLLLDAEAEVLAFTWADPDRSILPNGTYTYISRTAQITLTPQSPLLRTDAAIFMLGIMEWGNKYGYTEMGKMILMDGQGVPLAIAKLSAYKAPRTPSRAPDPPVNPLPLLNVTTSPYLWPIPTVPNFYLRFTTRGRPLARKDALQTLEAADASLIYLYHQAPEGVNPVLQGPRSWNEGAVSFSITPANELNVIDAGLFVLGVMQWGCLEIFVETDMELVRRIGSHGGQGGEMKGFGTAKLRVSAGDAA